MTLDQMVRDLNIRAVAVYLRAIIDYMAAAVQYQAYGMAPAGFPSTPQLRDGNEQLMCDANGTAIDACPPAFSWGPKDASGSITSIVFTPAAIGAPSPHQLAQLRSRVDQLAAQYVDAAMSKVVPQTTEG